MARIDLRDHAGAHPRLGAIDVVPFVPLVASTMDEAIRARDRFATWAGDELRVSCFVYGPERSLPDVRRTAFSSLAPDTGPDVPHPTAGSLRLVCSPLRLSATPAAIRRPPPRLGEHTDEVLREHLGLAESEVLALRDAGVT